QERTQLLYRAANLEKNRRKIVFKYQLRFFRIDLALDQSMGKVAVFVSRARIRRRARNRFLTSAILERLKSFTFIRHLFCLCRNLNLKIKKVKSMLFQYCRHAEHNRFFDENNCPSTFPIQRFCLSKLFNCRLEALLQSQALLVDFNDAKLSSITDNSTADCDSRFSRP
ncbi:unnamed protein product, partial [Oikopleura dioica]